MRILWQLLAFSVLAMPFVWAQHELNLTESCYGPRLTLCTLHNLSSTLDDPLEIVSAPVPQLDTLIIINSDWPTLQLARVPRDVFTNAPNLSSLTLYGTRLTKINPSDFVNAHQLRRLAINRNKLYHLAEKSFISLLELRELQIARSQLVLVHEHAFDGLLQLKRLDLQMNTIKSLPANVFQDLRDLEYIDLSGNLIESLTADTFASNWRLQQVLLAGNQFRIFEPNTLEHLPHLRLLDIKNCVVSELRLQSVDMLLAHNAGLQECSINGSIISMYAMKNRLQQLSVRDKLAVRELDLRDNQFTTLENFTGMENLQHLDLAHNFISDLATLSSPLCLPLPGLTTLNLAANSLTALAKETFLLTPKLNTLDLGYNQLSALDGQLFAPLYALERLYLGANQLTQLDYRSLIANNAHLREIILRDNPWPSAGYLRNMTTILERHHIWVSTRERPANGDIKCNEAATELTQDMKQNKMPPPSSWSRSDVLGLLVILLTLAIIVIQVTVLCRRKRRTGFWSRSDDHFVGSHHRLDLPEEADSEI